MEVDTTLRWSRDVQKDRLRYAGRVDYFVTPAEPAQRRYEALRSYFVDGASAAEVGSRFGYSPATVHQLAAELRAGRTQFFVSSKPGPRGPRKSGRIRDQVLALRAEDRSVTDIAERVSMDGTPVSAQTVWAILCTPRASNASDDPTPARLAVSSRSRRPRSVTGRPVRSSTVTMRG